MTDEQLTLLSAQAMGYKQVAIYVQDVGAYVETSTNILELWNPLGDSSQALSMIPKLHLHIGAESHCISVWAPPGHTAWQTESYGTSKELATRRAITRCAAAKVAS